MLTDINRCFVACEVTCKEKCRKDIEKCFKGSKLCIIPKYNKMFGAGCTKHHFTEFTSEIPGLVKLDYHIKYQLVFQVISSWKPHKNQFLVVVW